MFSPPPDDEERPSESAPDLQTTQEAKRDPFAALRHRDYRLYAIGGTIAALIGQMNGVAVGWELYERTNSPLALGLVGLVEVIPVILLCLVTGQVADRFPRKRVLAWCAVVVVAGALGLAANSYYRGPIWLTYLALLVVAIGRAFESPARQAWLFQLVPPEDTASAVTWNSSRWQLAASIGPALGGFAIAALGYAWPLFLAFAGAQIFNALLLLFIRGRPVERSADKPSLDTLLAGWRYVLSQRLFLATITLDMVAVFLGGAVALLPVFSRDVLFAGSAGLGWLRAAPAIGALFMSLALSAIGPVRRAGPLLLWSVAGFGVTTIVFGLSTSFTLSFAALMIGGAFDNISVVIRHTLLQVLAPDEMRGRISAINSVFIGTSNELGDFESGLMARFLGAPAAVAVGGVGTLASVAAIARGFPELHKLDRLERSES
jgi:MFS family permease